MLNLADLPDLDENDYKPLYVQLSDILSEYIRSHELDPENPLLSEKQSHGSVRREPLHGPAGDAAAGTGRIDSENSGKRDPSCPKRRPNAPGGACFTTWTNTWPHRGSPCHEPAGRHGRSASFELGDENETPAGRIRAPDQTAEDHRRPAIGLEIRWLPARFIKQLGVDDFQESPIMSLLNASSDTAVHQITYTVEPASCRRPTRAAWTVRQVRRSSSATGFI